MLIINLQNIEDLIFRNTEVINLLVDLRHIFDAWLLANRIPFLRSQRTKALVDLLNALRNNHISLLEEYFKDVIVLDKIDYCVIKNISLPLEFNPDQELSSFENFGNFTLFREEDKIYISFWR